MQDIKLYHLLKFYAKKWHWIAALTAIGALAGYVYSAYIQVPLYKSDATLLIISTDSVKTSQDSTLINNYIQLLKSRRVLEPAIKKQGSNISYDELVSSIIATNEKNTEVIKLSIASKDADMSTRLVNGVVASFRDEVKSLYKRDNISIVDDASRTPTPYNVRTVLLLAVTTAVGLLISLISLFFAYDISRTKKKIKETKRASNEIRGINPELSPSLTPLADNSPMTGEKKALRKSFLQIIANMFKDKRLISKLRSKTQVGTASKKIVARERLTKSVATMLVGVEVKPMPKKKTTKRAKKTNRKK